MGTNEIAEERFRQRPLELLRGQIVRVLRMNYGLEPQSSVCAAHLTDLFAALQRPLLEELQRRAWERDQAVLDMNRALHRADALEARLRALEGR